MGSYFRRRYAILFLIGSANPIVFIIAPLCFFLIVLCLHPPSILLSKPAAIREMRSFNHLYKKSCCYLCHYPILLHTLSEPRRTYHRYIVILVQLSFFYTLSLQNQVLSLSWFPRLDLLATSKRVALTIKDAGYFSNCVPRTRHTHRCRRRVNLGFLLPPSTSPFLQKPLLSPVSRCLNRLLKMRHIPVAIISYYSHRLYEPSRTHRPH